MKRDLSYPLTVAGAVLCLALIPLFEKMAVRHSESVLPLVLAINLLSIPVLLLPAWRRRPVPLFLRWRSLLLIGVLASGVVVLMNLLALQTTSATHRGVFQAMYPAATALFAYTLLGERLPRKSYAVIVAMIAGVILMSVRGMAWRFVPGDLILLGTLPLMGFCDAWAKRTLGSVSPEWVAFGRFTAGTLVLLPVLVLTARTQVWPDVAAWPWILLSGAAIGSGVLLLYRGMALKGASLTVALVSLAPVLTLLLEWGLFDGRFGLRELAGMSVVLAGAVLLSRPDFQKSDRRRPAAAYNKA